MSVGVHRREKPRGNTQRAGARQERNARLGACAEIVHSRLVKVLTMIDQRSSSYRRFFDEFVSAGLPPVPLAPLTVKCGCLAFGGFAHSHARYLAPRLNLLDSDDAIGGDFLS